MNGIGERLKLARRMARLSQQQLADQAGVSKMAISKYEHNLMVPNSEVLLKLTTALGVHMGFLLRPAPEMDIRPVYRAHSRMNKAEEEAVIAEVQEWLERYLAVEGFFPPEERPPFEFPPGFPYPVQRIEEVEHAADALREAWKIGTDAIENLTDLLEAQGIKIGLVKGNGHFDACTFWVNEQSPVIVVKSSCPGDRERFNLAHELGHIMLDVSPDIDVEKAAHRFAAAFLVPARAAVVELGRTRRSLDPYELLLLKQKYGMSMGAWIYRAKDLEILTQSDVQRHWKDFSVRGWRKQEPGEPLPCEWPQRMYRLIRRLLAEDIITRSRAKELLGERIELFTEKEQTVLEMRR